MIRETPLISFTWRGLGYMAGNDMFPYRRHALWLTHPKISPKLWVITGSLPINDSRNLRAIDEDISGEEIVVSEVERCVFREMAE
jgi:hypothetical protein